MNYRKLVKKMGRRLLRSGLTVATWGNISVRDERGRVYITPSGMDYRKIHTSDIVVTDPDGKILRGRRRPSTELALHLAVYRARPEVRAIVHTHPVYSTAFSCVGEDIPLFTDEAAQCLGDVCRTARYALPGTPELAAACAEALGERANCCLLKSHGAVCVGVTPERAFTAARVLETVAQTLLFIRAMGRTPDPISPENILAMQNFVRTGYGQP